MNRSGKGEQHLRGEGPSYTWMVWQARCEDQREKTGDFLRALVRRPTALFGGVVIVIYLLVALLAPYLSPYDPGEANLLIRNSPPFWSADAVRGHLLGTDQLGRDLLSRIIYGARVSLLIGFLASAISVVLGTALGLLTGYFRGWFDGLVSRFADLLLAFPFLIFAIGMMAFLGPGFWNLVLALSFKGWVEFFRLARGETLSEATKPYVEAARAVGKRDALIAATEILPNIVHSILVLATLRVGFMIIMEASLSFLGLGLPPRIPAWGSMVKEGKDILPVAYWVSTLPGMALLGLVLNINLFGEGLRDILDPRLTE